MGTPLTAYSLQTAVRSLLIKFRSSYKTGTVTYNTNIPDKRSTWKFTVGATSVPTVVADVNNGAKL